MNKTKIAKIVVRWVVGVSVTTTMNQIVANNTVTETAAQKAEIFVGSAVLGAMVADAARKYTDNLVDSVIEIKTSVTETTKP